MFDFIAELLAAVACNGASAASIVLSYQPKTPKCLVNKDAE